MVEIINLYNDCCYNALKNIPDNSIDCVICDPPYATVKGMELDGWSKEKTEWDNALNFDIIFKELERVCKGNSNILLFSQDPFTFNLYNAKRYNINFCHRLIWQKDHFASPLGFKHSPVNMYEDIMVFRKKYDTNMKSVVREYARKILKFINKTSKEIEREFNSRKLEHFFRCDSLQHSIPTKKSYEWLIENYKIEEMDGFLDYDSLKKLFNKKVFNTDKPKSNILSYKKEYKERYHPTQKPQELLKDLILTYTNEGDTILDFTMGSGSTGVACKSLNRGFIGIEKDVNYYEVAKKRINLQ